jgi:hypothetical protein
MGLGMNYLAMLNRGRKAGLNTRELYTAIASQASEGDQALGQTDTNGYVAIINQRGQRVYQPRSGLRPS